MQRLDLIVLTLYFAGLLALGFYYASKNKNMADMFAAGSESPWWVAGLSGFMTNFSAGTFVVWGAISFKYGLVGVSINLCYGLAALSVGYLVAGRWKRLGVRTPAQYLQLRFGYRTVQAYSFVLILFRTIGTAVALYSLAVLISALVPLGDGNFFSDPQTSLLSVQWAIILFGVIIVTYTMSGGLWAVLMTDVLQFLILNLAVVLIVPLLLIDVGGPSAFAEKAPETFFALTVPEFGWFFLFGWYVIHFFLIGADWAFAQRYICVPTPKDARKSAYLFGGLYLVSPFLWLLPPMIYRVIDPGADPEKAYILASSHVLPPGMIGLMVAAMFSATASLVSSQLNVFAGVLTDNFYVRLMKSPASDRHLIMVGRLITVVLGTALMGIALAIPYLGGAEEVIITVVSLSAVALTAPPIAGFFSRHLTAAYFWFAMAISVAIAVVAKFVLADAGFSASFPAFAEVGAWAKANARTLDIATGVLIPLLLLGLGHFVLQREAPGWHRVQEHARSASSAPVAKASQMPSRIVAVAITLCGIILMALAVLSAEDRSLIGSSAVTLFCIAGLIAYFDYRKNFVADRFAPK